MALEIDYQGSDFILRIVESGRIISVPANSFGIEYLKKIIQDSKRLHSNPKGYIRKFPTQHVIEQWVKADGARKEEEAIAKREEEKAELEAKHGIKLSSLEIKL